MYNKANEKKKGYKIIYNIVIMLLMEVMTPVNFPKKGDMLKNLLFDCFKQRCSHFQFVFNVFMHMK